MRFRELRLSNIRNVESATLVLGPRMNVLVGANGAGKTSLLEAAFMLSHGHSFRSTRRESVIRRGCDELSVFARLERGGDERRLGLQRDRLGWEARVDGVAVAGIADLLREAAVVCFEPGSHALISGSSEERRRFVDWALFHVEPTFSLESRRFRRALKQRNALLRTDADRRELSAWDAEFAQAGELLATMRADYLEQLLRPLQALCASFLPELGSPSFGYSRGWSAERSLLEALADREERDRLRGHTSAGPHRGDWNLVFVGAPHREHLSRGQAKLAALACCLAQAQLFAEQCGQWPVICLDDLASELDSVHRRSVLHWLANVDAQVLLTATDWPDHHEPDADAPARFHVEQGTVVRLL